MYYYDSNGDLAWTTDDDLARRQHVITMMTAHTYPLRPNTIGALYEKLGPAPTDIGRQEATARIQAVLRELGLADLKIESVVEQLDDGWKLAVTVGRTA